MGKCGTDLHGNALAPHTSAKQMCDPCTGHDKWDECQTNLGRVVDEFNADCEGDEVEIGFNNRYLLDALRNARTEKVRMEISGPLSPVKVLPAEGNDFLYLVLPVRFKND